MDKLNRLIRSRKFWAALVGLGMVVLRAFYPDFPITDDQVGNLVVILAGYILGVALEDSAYARGRQL